MGIKTTICLSKETKKRLREKAIHPRETNEQIIVRLINQRDKKKK